MNISYQSFHYQYIHKINKHSDDQIHVESMIPEKITDSRILQTVEYLNLNNNCIGDDDGTKCLQLFQHLPEIKHIDLSENFLGTKTLSSLPGLSFRKLRMLDLSSNKMNILDLIKAQEDIPFTIKHEHLITKTFTISFTNCDTPSLFNFDIEDLNITVHELLINVNNVKIPILAPKFIIMLDELDKPKSSSKFCSNRAKFLTAAMIKVLHPTGIISGLALYLFFNWRLSVIFSKHDQPIRDSFNQKLLMANDCFNKENIDELTCEELNGLNNLLRFLSKNLSPEEVSEHLDHDENTNYQSIYFELHLCIKIILASSFPEHRVNIHQFESLYKRNKNKRYYNPGFLYNSIILGLASRNFKLVTKQFEILSNQVNGKSPISKNLTKILPTLKEGILQSFGLNELDL